MILLRQSTDRTVMLGPFESSIGTAVTGLTVSQADVRLGKNGGNMAGRDSVGDCAHDEIGWYACSLNTADTDTLGILNLAVVETGALQVWHEYMVVTANFWDSMFSTDKLQTHVVEYTTGVIQASVFAAGAVDTAALGVSLADLPGLAWDVSLTGNTHNNPTSSGRRLRQLETIFVLAEGVAQGATVSTITLESGENSLDSFYNHVMVIITAGTGIGQTRAINAYTGGTLVADIVPDWITLPNSASTYELLADTGKHVIEVEAGAITDVSFGVSAITVSAFSAGAIDSSVLGVSLADILADTNELQTDWTDDGRLDAILDLILADTNELQTDWANDGRLDALLDTATGEEVLAPIATSLASMDFTPYNIMQTLFSRFFYKNTQTSNTQVTFSSSADTFASRVTSDDGTTQTINKAT